jgi:hypothetical protein
MAKKSFIDKMEEAAGISTPTPIPAARRFTPPPAEPIVQKPKSYKAGKLYPLKDITLIPRAKGGPVTPGKSKIMKMKGSALSGFMPSPKKSKRGKKRFAI